MRGSVITGSGRTGRKATHRQRRFIPGHTVTASLRPEPPRTSRWAGVVTRGGVLSDAVWSRIEPLLPSSKGKRGGRWADHRTVPWKASRGGFARGPPWRDVPDEFGRGGRCGTSPSTSTPVTADPRQVTPRKAPPQLRPEGLRGAHHGRANVARSTCRCGRRQAKGPSPAHALGKPGAGTHASAPGPAHRFRRDPNAVRGTNPSIVVVDWS